MGRAARANLRSPEGGKPAKFCSFHRCIRAVRTFGGDEARFHAWLDRTAAGPHHRAAMQRVWDEINPKPLVTLHQSVPDPDKQTTLRLVT